MQTRTAVLGVGHSSTINRIQITEAIINQLCVIFLGGDPLAHTLWILVVALHTPAAHPSELQATDRDGRPAALALLAGGCGRMHHAGC